MCRVCRFPQKQQQGAGVGEAAGGRSRGGSQQRQWPCTVLVLCCAVLRCTNSPCGCHVLYCLPLPPLHPSRPPPPPPSPLSFPHPPTLSFPLPPPLSPPLPPFSLLPPQPLIPPPTSPSPLILPPPLPHYTPPPKIPPLPPIPLYPLHPSHLFHLVCAPLPIRAVVCSTALISRHRLSPHELSCLVPRTHAHTPAPPPPLTRYRTSKEMSRWRVRDPVTRFRQWLQLAGWWDEGQEKSLRRDVRKQVHGGGGHSRARIWASSSACAFVQALWVPGPKTLYQRPLP